MRSIVVLPGSAPAWVQQHARHVAHRLSEHGMVVVAQTHRRRWERILPGEVGLGSVLGTGFSGHPVWTAGLSGALGLRRKRHINVIVWWPGASALLAAFAAVVSRLRGERVVLDEKLISPLSSRRSLSTILLQQLASDVVTGEAWEDEGQASERTIVAVCGSDEAMATSVLRAFSGFSANAVGGWRLRLHATDDASELVGQLAARHADRIDVEVGRPMTCDLAGAAVVVVPFGQTWSALASVANQGGSSAVLVGHPVATTVAQRGDGIWLATYDPSFILAAIETATGAVHDAPVSAERLRHSSDALVATVARLA